MAWTDEDQKQLDELLARREASVKAAQDIEQKLFPLLGVDAKCDAVLVLRNADEIIKVLVPHMRASCIEHEGHVRVRRVKYLKTEEAPNHAAAGAARKVSALKRMGPESGNVGFWFVDPDAYSIGPFKTVEEREAYIARLYVEGPADVLTTHPTFTPKGVTVI